jgi:hypothetical protein
VKAGTTWIQGKLSVIEGEALAMLEAIRNRANESQLHHFLE